KVYYQVVITNSNLGSVFIFRINITKVIVSPKKQGIVTGLFCSYKCIFIMLFRPQGIVKIVITGSQNIMAQVMIIVILFSFGVFYDLHRYFYSFLILVTLEAGIGNFCQGV